MNRPKTKGWLMGPLKVLAFVVLTMWFAPGDIFRWLTNPKRWIDWEQSEFKNWLESLGPGYCNLVVHPLRKKFGKDRMYKFPGWLLTTANGMTIIGLVVSILAAIELLLGFKVTAFWLFLVSRLPDFIDGWIARYAKSEHQGAIFDSNADKAGIFTTVAAVYWVIKHPSAVAWVLIAMLAVIDCINLAINMYHDRVAKQEIREQKAREGTRRARAFKAAVNVMAKLAGKIKQWGWGFIVGCLLFIIAYPAMRSEGVWWLFWFAMLVGYFGALGSLAGKLRDLQELLKSDYEATG